MPSTALLQSLPPINAALNSLSALLLLCALYLIRRRRAHAHHRVMLGACLTSALFLVSYLVYHAQHGTTHFVAPPRVRSMYLGILLSHTVLAALTLPLVAMSLYRAFRGQYHRHKRISRFTLPIWLYVSVTGVIIYLMLYQLYPQR